MNRWHAIRARSPAQANPSDLIKPASDVRARVACSEACIRITLSLFLLGLRLGNR